MNGGAGMNRGAAVPPTFAHVLWERAQLTPDRTAVTYLSEPAGRHTYGSLYRAVSAVAELLSEAAAPGDRVVLLMPPGLDYVAGFLGCLHAGLIAVPAHPPLGEHHLPRIAAMIADARPRVVLTAAPVDDGLRAALVGAGAGVGDPIWISVDAAPTGGGAPVTPVGGRDGIAFLQYTSGSTSDPKGVIVSHANLFDNSAAIRSLFGTGPESTAVLWLPPYHDMGLIGGILHPLHVGFPVVLMSPLDFLAEPASWLRAISEHGGTVCGGPSFAFDLCVRKVTSEQRAGLDLRSWSLAFCGSEPVRAAALRRFADAFEPHGFRRDALHPCYGLAESTLITTAVDRGSDLRILDVDGQVSVSCGRPAPGHQVSLCAPGEPDPLPDGVVGEICIDGPSVTGGYWADPIGTAQAFVPAPGGRRRLRTGDLGRRSAGELFVTGRLKDLIIVRGRNVAAEDVERVVAGCHPAIRPGRLAAFGCDGAAGEELVVLAELAAAAGPDASAAGIVDEVASAVRTALVAHLGITADRVLLARSGAIAKTPSGKVRRAECRRRYREGELDLIDAAVVRLSGEQVADLATEVLDCAVPAGVPLTSLGLDSLHAVELTHLVRQRHGVALSLRDLLSGADCTTLARTALTSDAGPHGTGDAVSAGERELWLAGRLAGDPAHYVLAVALDVDGRLDVELLGATLRLLTDRHPALRTYFPEVGGEPRRRPWPAGSTLEVLDLGPADDRVVDRRVREMAGEGIDPTAGAPWRVVLLRRASGSDVLAFFAHHMVCDLWSLDVLAHEFGEAYAALRAGRVPQWNPAGDPGRLAAQQIAMLAGDRGRELAAFWQEQLSELPGPGGLPQARRRRTNAPAGRVEMRLPAPVADRVTAVAAAAGATRYDVLVTAVAWLVHAYTGERRFVLGVPAPGRLAPDSARAVGYFVNVLPLVCEVAPGRDFRWHLERVRDRLAGVLAHQDHPHRLLAERYGPGGGEPLVRVLVLHRQAPTGDALAMLRPGGGAHRLTVRSVEQRNAPFELTIELATEPDGLACEFTFDADALAEPDVAAAARHWGRLLEQVVQEPAARPADVDLLTAEERRRLLLDWNAPVVAPVAAPGGGEPATLHEAVLATAARHGHAVAAHDEGGSITYRDLDRRSAALAAALAGHGAGPGRPVGLLLERSTGLLVGMLAALRVGAPYVPLDPAHPDPRLARIADDAGLAVVVTDAALRSRAPAGRCPTVMIDGDSDPGPLPVAPGHPDVPAYLMYTSGSSGAPKGVVCGHRGVLNLLADLRRRHVLGPGDRCAWWTSAGFDVSVFEIFSALTAGACVEVCPPASRYGTDAFMEWATRRGVTAAYVPPHLLAGLPEWLQRHPGRTRLRLLVVSVEPVPQPLLRRIMGLVPGLTVLNGYGPTEATIFSTLHAVDGQGEGDGITPMGRGVRNCPHHLLDADLRLVPLGVAGEVCIGGVGLAHGYHGQPGLTARAFVPSPFGTGERLYRTGDLARYDAAGQLVFVGRLDDQLKVRGMRVEPGEVEAVISGHPEVSTALVLAETTSSGRRLVGYATVAPDRVGDRALAGDIVRHVRDRLPGPMVPRRVLLLDEWPTTVNGKIDRTRLPSAGPADRDHEPPVGPVEAAIAHAWSTLLGGARIGRGDDFFELGGDSLLAARMVAGLAEQLGAALEPAHVLANPTVRDLATAVEQARAGALMPECPDRTVAAQALVDHVAALPDDVVERFLTAEAGGGDAR